MPLVKDTTDGALPDQLKHSSNPWKESLEMSNPFLDAHIYARSHQITGMMPQIWRTLKSLALANTNMFCPSTRYKVRSE